MWCSPAHLQIFLCLLLRIKKEMVVNIDAHILTMDVRWVSWWQRGRNLGLKQNLHKLCLSTDLCQQDCFEFIEVILTGKHVQYLQNLWQYEFQILQKYRSNQESNLGHKKSLIYQNLV